MSPTLLIVIALIIVILVLRIIFKIAGWILKLLILAAIGFALWWVFSGM